MTEEHVIYLTRVEDGSYLCMSVNTPRFALSAPTEAEAKAKAQRAFAFYHESKHSRQPAVARETIVKNYSYEKELLCA